MISSRRSGQCALFERRHERYGRYAAARCAATSYSPIPMIFRLIDSRIMLNALPQPPRVHKHIRDVAGAISAIDGRSIATEGVAGLTEHWHHVGVMRRVLLRILKTDERPLVADSVAKVFLRHGTQILRAVGATIE